MFDQHETASLRGFDMSVPDIGDQLHLRHPLLSLGDDSTLYVARRLDWRNDQSALTVADPSEASELATLLPDAYRRPIESGEAVVVAGAEFVQAVNDAGIQLDGSEMSFTSIHESKCRMSTATQGDFEKLQTRLADEALTAFDEALGSAAREQCQLSEHGSGALLVLRGCGTSWREKLAIRELAGAKQNREFDLYRRLLDGFSIELDAPPDDLHMQVGRHIELAASQRPVTVEGVLERIERYGHAVAVLDTDSALRQPRGIQPEDTLWIGTAVVEMVKRSMREMDNVLSPEAKSRCIGENFEERLKQIEDAVGEVRQLLTSIHASDALGGKT